jgi:hypothetical protein
MNGHADASRRRKLVSMASLPPDDRPPPEPTSEVAALVAAGPPGPDNPVTVGAVFWTAVTDPDGPDLEVLSIVVTPESWPYWGDFRRAAALLPGYVMEHRTTPAADDPGVAYLTYSREADESDVVVATLVRRPQLGGWRVHALGASVRPERVPHDE